MKPLLINTYDQGGAANACLRLHQSLLNQNIDSKVLLKNKTKPSIPETYQITLQTLNRSFGTKISEKTIRILKELKLYTEKPDSFLANRSKGLEMFSYPQSAYDITKSELYRHADIINLHWVANFLDYPSFFKKNRKPVIWTLHDQNPFTGGEHLTETVLGVDENGYPIKRKITNRENEVFKKNIEIKKKALNQIENLRIITLSKWMYSEVKKSKLFYNYNVNIIPNGINSKIFKPRDKNYSRELLNIPPQKTVLLFVSTSIERKLKGFEYLLKAFEKINNKNIVLLSIGSKKTELPKNENIIELGSIQDELLMSIVYSAADVFLIPSLMDNLPNTVLESIMCGTPVIGFPVGGIPDMIQDGENGYLTEEISVSALTKTIEKFLAKPNIFDQKEIRNNAKKKYDSSVQAQTYINLFNEVLNK